MPLDGPDEHPRRLLSVLERDGAATGDGEDKSLFQRMNGRQGRLVND